MTFFEFMWERQTIYLKKQAGVTPPWTTDSALKEYSFTNVYRENDKTTKWFAHNIRNPLKDQHIVLFATICFRWFNFIDTGQKLLEDTHLVNSVFCRWDPVRCRELLINQPKWVTGAYIIKTPDGMNKLDGVIWCIDNAWKEYHHAIPPAPQSLEKMSEEIKQLPYMGDFMAYEVVTDLRHTIYGRYATDIMTWANPGPGAMRGLNRIHKRDLNLRRPKEMFIQEMRDLLEKSKTEWPNNTDYPPLEMREIEHSLCEYDKFLRVTLGEGRPRSKYHFTK